MNCLVDGAPTTKTYNDVPVCDDCAQLFDFREGRQAREHEAVIVTGSTLYGMATPDSDVDTVTIGLPTSETILGLAKHKRVGGDRSYYALDDAIRLMREGSVNMIELLWATPEYAGPFWDQVVRARRSFLSGNFMLKTAGFARNLARNVTPEGWGDPRVRKSAAHALRVLYAARHMIDDVPVFPLPEADDLLAIRQGEMTWSEWAALLDQATFWADLPDVPAEPIKSILRNVAEFSLRFL